MKSGKRNLSAISPSYIPWEKRDGLGRPAEDRPKDYSSLSDQQLLDLIAHKAREALSHAVTITMTGIKPPATGIHTRAGWDQTTVPAC